MAAASIRPSVAAAGSAAYSASSGSGSGSGGYSTTHTSGSRGRNAASGGGGSASGTQAALHMLPLYLRRIVKWRQMDLEYTAWLMLQLCTNPKLAYRHTTYHKQTHNQWARDDPAFVVICSALVSFSATAYCIAFGYSVWHSLLTVLSAVVVDFLLLGVAIGTAGWLLSNKYLRASVPGGHAHAVEQHVEWLYAFDVHCNAYFPLFLLLHVLQYFLLPLLLSGGFIGCLVSNALYAVALAYYHYVTFLGYNALPFLEHTELFLYPIGVLALLAPLSLLSGFNPSVFVLRVYFGSS
ncbi:UNC-50 [Pycnococcus provasolii]|eukprot:CAMPEP_0119188984 /NCGR_PEP_ID=MMETSP1316-20130426/427_1 /TAXON_ID=41880 /ORGANISM="Pycnococcus provasolii, Strain RCC2336" /LENGTH=294 /DNA_ID=CAMNT_0007183517 /DNA_START=82 /DNA_END=966 /DNA_ORIENTATION=+